MRTLRNLPAFLACVAFIAVWWIAFTLPAPTAAQCVTDAECAQTPACRADTQCDGGPY